MNYETTRKIQAVFAGAFLVIGIVWIFKGEPWWGLVNIGMALGYLYLAFVL